MCTSKRGELSALGQILKDLIRYFDASHCKVKLRDFLQILLGEFAFVLLECSAYLLLNKRLSNELAGGGVGLLWIGVWLSCRLQGWCRAGQEFIRHRRCRLRPSSLPTEAGVRM